MKIIIRNKKYSSYTVGKYKYKYYIYNNDKTWVYWLYTWVYWLYLIEGYIKHMKKYEKIKIKNN